MNSKQENYNRHLKQLSDGKLKNMLAEYNFKCPYTRLRDAAIKINDFCQNYAPRIRWHQQIETIEVRLFAYTHGANCTNAISIPKLRQELDKLQNIHVSAILPRK